MSEPADEPQVPAGEPEAPVETDEPGPSDDEAGETEQDEDEPAADEQDEPEPEPQHEARGVSDTEMEKRFGKAEKAAAAYARRISDIYEEDVVDLVECPLCPSIHKAFVNINDAGRVPDDVKQGVLAFLGFATEIEYQESSTFHTCRECGGKGKVKTGSQVPGLESIKCPPCGGSGYIGPAGAVRNGEGDHELVLTGPLHYEDPGEAADTDPSGEPRLLPDGRENPNFGKWPQFKIPVPPWGTTAGLTVQDAVAQVNLSGLSDDDLREALPKLVEYGILELVEDTGDPLTSVYRMPDPEGVGRALDELGVKQRDVRGVTISDVALVAIAIFVALAYVNGWGAG